MPRFLDTRGNSSLSVAICSRCSRKLPIGELFVDPDTKLRVCAKDLDAHDPWRLPARPPDRFALRFSRPDTQLSAPDPYVPDER